jgi:hypothetical protein
MFIPHALIKSKPPIVGDATTLLGITILSCNHFLQQRLLLLRDLGDDALNPVCYAFHKLAVSFSNLALLGANSFLHIVISTEKHFLCSAEVFSHSFRECFRLHAGKKSSGFHRFLGDGSLESPASFPPFILHLSLSRMSLYPCSVPPSWTSVLVGRKGFHPRPTSFSPSNRNSGKLARSSTPETICSRHCHKPASNSFDRPRSDGQSEAVVSGKLLNSRLPSRF